ncbi:unnamed protein product [Sphagnum balticum]
MKGLKKQNKSDQMLMKKRDNDMILVNMGASRDYSQGLGEEFQRGNTLTQAERDDLPPSNLYATEKLPKGS